VVLNHQRAAPDLVRSTIAVSDRCATLVQPSKGAAVAEFPRGSFTRTSVTPWFSLIGSDPSVAEQATSMRAPKPKKHLACIRKPTTRHFVFIPTPAR
jgi:hypothetical protein